MRRARTRAPVPRVGDSLYRLLVAPAEAELAGADQLVVVSDKGLDGLPVHALRGEDKKYLIEKFAISYAPSITALTKMCDRGDRIRARAKPDGTTALVVGVGEFGGREAWLPAAEPEAKAVADLFAGNSKLLLGGDATQARVAAAWADCRFIHFATHGRLNAKAPVYSALVLSQSDATDEGLLTAADLLELDADLGAEMVVLSACATGLGATFGGEGVYGMSWAWFAAGVPSLVVSQWIVSDESTTKLMGVFYTKLLGGASKADALRQAQLARLKDKATRHPFHWAPVVLLGDPR